MAVSVGALTTSMLGVLLVRFRHQLGWAFTADDQAIVQMLEDIAPLVAVYQVGYTHRATLEYCCWAAASVAASRAPSPWCSVACKTSSYDLLGHVAVAVVADNRQTGHRLRVTKLPVLRCFPSQQCLQHDSTAIIL